MCGWVRIIIIRRMWLSWDGTGDHGSSEKSKNVMNLGSITLQDLSLGILDLSEFPIHNNHK